MPNTNQPDRASRGAIIAGYVFAVLMPFVGLIVGIVVMCKRRLGHGIAIVALSTLVFGVVAMAVLDSAADEFDREAQRIEQEYDREAAAAQREADAAQREYDEIVENAEQEAVDTDEMLTCVQDAGTRDEYDRCFE